MVQQGETLESRAAAQHARAAELQAVRRIGASATSRVLRWRALLLGALTRFSSQPSPRWGSLVSAASRSLRATNLQLAPQRDQSNTEAEASRTRGEAEASRTRGTRPPAKHRRSQSSVRARGREKETRCG